MTPAEARQKAAALRLEADGYDAAAAQAESEGRDLVAADLHHFAALDAAARAELQVAIDSLKKD